LAAPKPAMGEQIVKLSGTFANKVREHLSLFLARQVRARRRSGQIELRGIAGMLGHGGLDTRRNLASGRRIAGCGRLVKSPFDQRLP